MEHTRHLARVSARPLLGAVFALAATGLGCAPDEEGDALAEASEVSRACASLASGPFTPVSRGHWFDGSEDFAFDGRGGVVAKRGNDLVRVDASGQTTRTLAALPGRRWGFGITRTATSWAPWWAPTRSCRSRPTAA